MFTLTQDNIADEEDPFYVVTLANKTLGYSLTFALDPLTTTLSKADQISLSIHQSNGPESIITLTLTSDALITAHTSDPGTTTFTLPLTPDQVQSMMEYLGQVEKLM